MRKTMSLLLIAGAMALSAAEPLWKNGVPPPLAEDNPYLSGARNIVKLNYDKWKKGDDFSTLWLSWAVFDKHSPYYGNREIRDAVFRKFDAVTLEREKKPSGFWTILEDTETFNLWILYGGLDKKQLNLWKERLRPSYQKSLREISDPAQWMSKAANTLLQTAMALEFGAILYERLDPNDKDVPAWRAQARKNIRQALSIQLPGGAFSYINNSGPDPIYFNFDAAHLGRYYQLTGDENAKLALQRMAEWANAATISGQLTVFSSPWWKHFMGTGGPYTGFEHVAAVTENPLALDLMRQRRSYIQPYVWTYGNMYAWKKKAPGEKISRDRCMFDRNANGPALRIGGLDAEMPSRPWGDSQFGMGVSNEKGWTSCFNAVYVTVPGKRTGHLSYIMIPPDEYRQHDGVVGKNWIAGAGTFHARRGIYGQVPPESPFRRTDLWYADENGAAGVISLVIEKKSKLPGVEIWVSSGMAKNLKPEKDKLGFADFTMHFSGAKLLEPFRQEKCGFVYYPFAGAGKREYQAGERFSAQVSVVRPGKAVLSAGPLVYEPDGIASVEILRDGKSFKILKFNPTARTIRNFQPYQMKVEEKS